MKELVGGGQKSNRRDLDPNFGGLVSAAGAIAAIQKIGRTISSMATISISASLEEQGPTTQEIACIVQKAARVTDQVTLHTRDIRDGAQTTGRAAARLLTAAQALAQRSTGLTQRVRAFLSTVKAA